MEVLSRYIDGLEVLYQMTSFDMKQVGVMIEFIMLFIPIFLQKPTLTIILFLKNV
jgi:hypothetical protein